ncbi:MAG TPA: DNA double-strand break repair nuclease NurA [Anaerolineae bacterium]|nr:DNA double-strand break repair nuclease NurA [Anaerolineae bacterium]
MTLELNKVTEQVDEMGRVLAERAARQRRALPAARELLHQFAYKQEELRRVAESDAGQRWRCANPGDEPLDQSFPVVDLPDCVTIVAADGSQIYPDRHGMAFYYVINVGSVIFRHGSGQAPDVGTDPRLFYGEDKMYPGGNPVSSDLVSVERDLSEMQTLAALTVSEPAEGPPRLAVADGPLLIWLQRAAIPEGRRERILGDYLNCIDRLRATGAMLAGFVSRPHSAEVVALLYLAQLEPEERLTDGSLAETDYRGLTDRALFGYLEPGERSALFVRGTAANRDFQAKGHSVWFFYLNTGADLARIEVPEWVARRAEYLDLVQAAVYDQCRINNGYPYVLTRADEQAVILSDERDALEAMLMAAMSRHGLPPPELSRKAQQKQVARWRRRK